MPNDTPDWYNVGQGIETKIGSLNCNAQNQAFSVNVTPPSFTATLELVADTVGGGLTITQVTVIGVQSGASYRVISASNLSPGFIFYVPISLIRDTSFTVTVTTGTASGFIVTIGANPAVRAMRVDSDSGSTVTTTNQGVQPALWQQATSIAQVSVTLANGATAVFDAGTAGQTIRLFGASVAVQGTTNTNFGVMEDTNSNAVMSLNGGQSQYLAAGAAPMPGGAGVGLRIRCTAPGGMSANGAVSWSKG